MTRREQLQERYEDALFALLMDDFAVAEGEAAIKENERLQKDPSYEVPPEVRKRCLKTISRCCQKRTLHSTGRVLRRGFIKVAVITTICILLFTTALAVSPTFRTNTLNFMIEVFDDRTALSFSVPALTQAESTGSDLIVANWLPNGYTLTEQSDSAFRSSVCYHAELGNEIIVNVFKGENGVLNIDTEDAYAESVEIQGHAGILTSKDGLIQLVWGNEEGAYKVEILMEGMSDTDIQNILRIAENLCVEIT